MLDRWVNAADKWSHHYAMFNLDLSKVGFTPDKWHELRFEWKDVTKRESACTFQLDGRLLDQALPLQHKTVNGLSYVHFISADTLDPQGFSVATITASQ